MTLSYETLTFLRTLVGAQTLNVGHPDFCTMAPQLVTVLEELDAALVDAQDDDTDKLRAVES